jgi:hypothetical protein
MSGAFDSIKKLWDDQPTSHFQSAIIVIVLIVIIVVFFAGGYGALAKRVGLPTGQSFSARYATAGPAAAAAAPMVMTSGGCPQGTYSLGGSCVNQAVNSNTSAMYNYGNDSAPRNGSQGLLGFSGRKMGTNIGQVKAATLLGIAQTQAS